MKNRLLISFVLILLLTTYQLKIDSNLSNFLKIEKIIVENNEVVMGYPAVPLKEFLKKNERDRDR